MSLLTLLIKCGQSVDCVDVSGVGTESNNVICSGVVVFKGSKIYWK